MKLRASKEQKATETFISEGGYYVIQQNGEYEYSGHDEEIKILLSPDLMRALIIDMQDNLLDADAWWAIQYPIAGED